MPKNDRNHSPQARWDRESTNSTLSAMSRVLAVLVFMILIGLAGGLLDRAFGTSIWTLIGFLVGIAFAMVGMWYVVKVAEYENRQGSHTTMVSDESDNANEERPNRVRGTGAEILEDRDE